MKNMSIELSEEQLSKYGKILVAFKIGRGGRYNSGGYKTYVGEHDINNYVGNLFISYENYIDVKRSIGDRPNLIELFEKATNDDNELAIKRLSLIGLDLGKLIYTDSWTRSRT